MRFFALQLAYDPPCAESTVAYVAQLMKNLKKGRNQKNFMGSKIESCDWESTKWFWSGEKKNMRIWIKRQCRMPRLCKDCNNVAC